MRPDGSGVHSGVGLSICAWSPAQSPHWGGTTGKDISKVESARLVRGS